MTGIIKNFEAFEARLPLPQPLQLGELVIPHREYTFVRLHDDEGRVGHRFCIVKKCPGCPYCIEPHRAALGSAIAGRS